MKEDVVTVGLLSLHEKNTDRWLAIMDVQLASRDVHLTDREY